MDNVISYLRELNFVTMIIRIVLAFLCGGLIGMQRERHGRSAGFDTYHSMHRVGPDRNDRNIHVGYIGF